MMTDPYFRTDREDGMASAGWICTPCLHGNPQGECKYCEDIHEAQGEELRERLREMQEVRTCTTRKKMTKMSSTCGHDVAWDALCARCFDAFKRAAADSEVRTTSSTGGQKGVKQERFDLVPVEALEALARHYGKGAEKYEGNQWRKGYEWSKSFAAMMRHAWKFWAGEDIDPETGSPHIIAVAWHAFCLYTFSRDFPEYDDRYKKEQK